MISVWITAVIGVLYAVWVLGFGQRRKPMPAGLKEVPWVKGSWPLVGHGLVIGSDIVGFVRRCIQEYGPVFHFRIFMRDIIIVCDRSLVHEFFQRREKDMSLYEVLDHLFFFDAFSDRPETFPAMVQLIKGSVALRADEFIPKIHEQAKIMIGRIKAQAQAPADLGNPSTEPKKEIDLAAEAARFAAHTTAECFLGFKMTEEFWEMLLQFKQQVDKIIVLTYFVPKFFLRLRFNRGLSKSRRAMTRMLAPEVEKYRQDPDKTDSALFRQCVDRTKLSNEEIGEVAVFLFYASLEPPALGLTVALFDLSRHGDWWDTLAEELKHDLDNDDMRAIFANPKLDACVMESARLHSHALVLNRAPQFSKSDEDDKEKRQVGDWFVGDAQMVALCEPMLMVYENAADQFEKAETYDPERFLEPRNESKRPEQIMTWGAGVHQCPGKLFSLLEIKTVMALMITTFGRPILPPKEKPKGYYSPSPFAEAHTKLSLTQRAAVTVANTTTSN